MNFTTAIYFLLRDADIKYKSIIIFFLGARKMPNKSRYKTLLLAAAVISALLFNPNALLFAQTEVKPKITRSKPGVTVKSVKKAEPTTEDILKAAGGSDIADIDKVDVAVEKLGYDNISGTDGVSIKTPLPKPKKPYLGNFTANTLMASNGLIELVSPEPTGRGKFQVGAQYLHRRIQTSPSLQLNARVMFQTLTFGVMKNVEVGFGSSGYYKSSNNTTFLTGKIRLTNPERSKFDFSLGAQTIDFGSTDITNVTNYYGTAAFDIHGSKLYFQAVNDGNNKYYDLPMRGGVIIQMRELVPQPSCLIIEALQDVNNNFSRYNFGIRPAVAENALLDMFLMKDININELSPAVGLSLKF